MKRVLGRSPARLAHDFPRLPHRSEFNRRVRWLWGALESVRQRLVATVPEDIWQQLDTTALLVKHPSRVRWPDQWPRPAGLRAGFGRAAAPAEWFDGFHLALCTDLGTRLVRAWALVLAAVDERVVSEDLLIGCAPTGLLLDRGFAGRAWATRQAERGTRVVLAPSRADRCSLSAAVRRPVAVLRNPSETTSGEIMVHLGLATHGAKTFWGLLTRTAATLLAHTWLHVLPPNPQLAPQTVPFLLSFP